MSLNSAHEVFNNQDYVAAAERKKRPDTSGLRALGRFARLVASDETALKIQNKYDNWREKRRAKKREGEVPFDTLFAMGEGREDAIQAQKAGVVLEQPEAYTPDPKLVPRAQGGGVYRSQSLPASANMHADDLMAHATAQAMNLLRDNPSVSEFRLPANVGGVGGDSPTELPAEIRQLHEQGPVAPRALTPEERDAGGLTFEKDRTTPHTYGEVTTKTTAEFQKERAERAANAVTDDRATTIGAGALSLGNQPRTTSELPNTPAPVQKPHEPRHQWHDENTGPNPLVGANN
jgi:hypothetical protein